MDYQPLMILAAVPCPFKITSNWADTLFFFLEAYVEIFWDLDTRSLVADATSDENFRQYVTLSQKSSIKFVNSLTFE